MLLFPAEAENCKLGNVHLCAQGVPHFESVDEILKCDHSNESYWAVLSCGAVCNVLYKVILTFESVDEILKCDHSNESYWAVLSCGAVCYAVQGGSNFWRCGWNPKVWPFFKWKLLSSTSLWCCLLCKVVLTFDAVDEILSCDYFVYSVWNVVGWYADPRRSWLRK